MKAQKLTLIFVLIFFNQYIHSNDSHKYIRFRIEELMPIIANGLNKIVLINEDYDKYMPGEYVHYKVFKYETKQSIIKNLNLEEVSRILKFNAIGIFVKENFVYLTKTRYSFLKSDIQVYEDHLENYDAIVSKTIKLKHVDVDEVRKLYKYIVHITTPINLPDNKSIIVTDFKSYIDFFMEEINKIDIPK